MTQIWRTESAPSDGLASALLQLERLALRHVDPMAGPRLVRQDLQQHLMKLGITRVGDVTALDRIGLPVWFACRPQSLSLSVSQGKGLDADQAWVSAVMESAESALAERHDRLVHHVASIDEMKRSGLPIVSLEGQTRCASSRVSQEQPLAWVKGLSWRKAEVVYAPYELIGMDMLTHAPWDSRSFQVSSAGLAAGGCMADAVHHGLMELIEDDALALDQLPARAKRNAVELNLCSSALRDALEKIEAAGCSVGFRLLMSDTGVPVVRAEVGPAAGADHTLPPFGGYAARHRIEDAALAAVLEAVQTRLTFIAGSREDLLPRQFEAMSNKGSPQDEHHIRCDGQIDRGNVQNPGLDILCDQLFAAGVPDIHVFPLGGEEFGFQVVRVLADDMLAAARPEGVVARGRVARNVMQATLG